MYASKFDQQVIKSAKRLGIPVKGDMIEQLRGMIKQATRLLQPLISLSKGSDPKSYKGDIVKFVSYMKQVVAFSERVVKIVSRNGRGSLDPISPQIASAMAKQYSNALRYMGQGVPSERIASNLKDQAQHSLYRLSNALSLFN